MGPLSYAQEEGEVFLGRSITQHKNISNQTAAAIDEEVRKIVDRNYQTAEDLLKGNLDKLHAMASALIKYETIDGKQIKQIMDGEEPQPPEGWNDGNGKSVKTDLNAKPDDKLGHDAAAAGSH
jgi:cell division protease FtsH